MYVISNWVIRCVKIYVDYNVLVGFILLGVYRNILMEGR